MIDKPVCVEVVFKEEGRTITLHQEGKGEVLIKSAKTGFSDKATSGEIINISFTPDKKSVFESAGVTASGKNIPLEFTDANHAHFTMPDNDVTVNVKFKDISDLYNGDGSLKPGKYSINTYFGSYYVVKGTEANPVGMYGAMGFPPQQSRLVFTVKEDGTTGVDSWITPSIQNPLGSGVLPVKWTVKFNKF